MVQGGALAHLSRLEGMVSNDPLATKHARAVMKIETPKLRKAVAAVIGIAGRKTLPILSCLRMEATKNQLLIEASDIDQRLAARVECEGDLAPCCVPGHRLSTLLSFMGDEVQLLADSGRLAMVGKSDSVINVLPTKEFPDVPKDVFTTFGINCTDLADCIERVAWAAETRIAGKEELKGTHVMCSAKRIYVEASNGARVAAVDHPAIAADCEFILPHQFAEQFLEALRQDGAELARGERYLRVTHDGGLYWCRQLEATYPNTKPIFNQEREEVGTFKASEWLPALKAVQSLQLDDHRWRSLKLSFGKAGALFHFRNGDGESLEASAPGKFKNHDGEIHPERWIQGIAKFGDCEVTLSENPGQYVLQNGELTAIFVKMNPFQPKE